MTKQSILATASVISLFVVATVTQTFAADTTLVIRPYNLENSHAAALNNQSWFFYNDETDTVDNSLGSMVNGPSTPPLGNGSAQITVTGGTQRRNLATYQFKNIPLADITVLKYSTYNASATNQGGVNRSGYLNFNVDFAGNDTWQRRLVFLPADNGPIVPDTWQEWDAINGGNALWRYSGSVWPNSATPGSTPKTWNQILSEYSGVKTRTSDSWMGIRVGEPYPNAYTENIDAFKFGTNAGTMTFDFEPSDLPAACQGMTFSGPAIIGTQGTDKLTGTSGNDLIIGLGGSDKIDGKGGDDCLIGGDGSDRLIGGLDNDVIFGGNDSDSLSGEHGSDYLYGENGSDSLKGGIGQDFLYGGDGSDSLKGEAGDDTIDGEGGVDSAHGGSGSQDACIAESKKQCEII